MRILKNILSLAVIVLCAGGSYYFLTKGPCDSPVAYSVGSIDERFGINQEKLVAAAKAAEDAWEKAAGKDLFAYSPKGKLPINLVYDERQATSERNRGLVTQVGAEKQTADSVKADLEALKSRYENLSKEYEALVSSFRTRQEEYNASVAYWNERGGAPQSEFSKLSSEKKQLQALASELEPKRLEVNRLASEVNEKVRSFNGLVRTINSTVEVINKSADKEFEQGEFIQEGRRKEIDIYEFKDVGELERVIAHEMGHALGVDHNENPESIMYYLNSGANLALSREDIESLKAACKFKE